MKQKIEELLHRIEELKAQKIQDVEDIRVKLLGKKGEITKHFELWAAGQRGEIGPWTRLYGGTNGQYRIG